MTATILNNENYVAENLIIPECVFDDGKFYKVTYIGQFAFFGCSGLTGNLTIPDSVTNIDEGAFMYCSWLTGSLTIPNSVTSIGHSAFAYCSELTGSLTIPNSVISIGERAFQYCMVSGSLTIPNSVISIGDSAFIASGFTNITLDGYDNKPNWSGVNIFLNLHSIGTVSTSHGDLTADYALDYLVLKGLPNTWTPV